VAGISALRSSLVRLVTCSDKLTTRASVFSPADQGSLRRDLATTIPCYILFPSKIYADAQDQPNVYRRRVHDEVSTIDRVILDTEALDLEKEGSAVGDYKYHPLDHTKQQIRLIRLLESEEDGDPICLYIDTFEISNAPRYTALSYVWGPPTPIHELYIEDERSYIVKLDVRDNLYRFCSVSKSKKKRNIQISISGWTSCRSTKVRMQSAATKFR
jgi:hypothetical protein